MVFINLVDIVCKITNQITIGTLKRFWSKVDIKTGEKCWAWKGVGKIGYGLFSLNGKKIFAHRVSFAIANDGIPIDSESIVHLCGNRGCVNPMHLASLKPKSKLSEKEKEEIRKKYTPRTTTIKSLAEKYGVSSDQVYRVITQHKWHS